ncbi:MAG TPA: PAS domain-containing protein, partial [Desulfobacterales bacterium]|nr:PAS domain-containing protein [Desulfobacterales bacterium]
LPGGCAAEAGLRRTLRRALELSRDGMFLVEEGRIRLGNRFLSDWGGYRGEEVEGTCLASFFDPQSEAAVEASCRAAAAGGPQLEIAAVMVRKDGGRVAVGLKAEGCRFDGQPCALVLVEPCERTACEAARWDADAEAWFAPEGALAAPACA